MNTESEKEIEKLHQQAMKLLYKIAQAEKQTEITAYFKCGQFGSMKCYVAEDENGGFLYGKRYRIEDLYDDQKELYIRPLGPLP